MKWLAICLDMRTSRILAALDDSALFVACLSFLLVCLKSHIGFKKSWHTKNLNNVETVWAAEQKDAKEKKAIAEFEKQIREERQINELRALQASSGNAVKIVDNSLDWMYEGPSGFAAKKESSEEYLLGKIFKGKNTASVNILIKTPPKGSFFSVT